MHFLKPLTLVAIASPALAYLPARLYIHTPSSSSSSHKEVSITAPEANAILSYHLGIDKFETLPEGLKAGGRKAQIVFGEANGELREGVQGDEKKVVFVVYGSDGKDILPTPLSSTTALVLNSPPPPESWDSLFQTYLHRFLTTFSLTLKSLPGVHHFLSSSDDHHHELAEWARDVAATAEEWVRWGEEKLGLVAQQVMPKEAYSKWLTDLHIADPTARPLFAELDRLTSAVDQLPLSTPLTIHRLTGLIPVAAAHTRSSAQYAGSTQMLQQYLSAHVAATLASNPEATIILLAVPEPPKHHRLGKRTTESLLTPFKTSPRSFQSPQLLERRAEVFSPRAEAKKPKALPIISSSRKCYETEADCGSATADCNGHGKCVKGQRTIGGSCFVCQCGTTTSNHDASITSWSGEMCQKQDVSSQFVLIAGSTIALLVILVASVAVLYSVGDEPLPQQLGSVSVGGKKMD